MEISCTVGANKLSRYPHAGATKGPSKAEFEDMSFQQKSATGDKAMDETVLEIRKRVQEVNCGNLVLCLKYM